jgi:hypothetical protein
MFLTKMEDLEWYASKGEIHNKCECAKKRTLAVRCFRGVSGGVRGCQKRHVDEDEVRIRLCKTIVHERRDVMMERHDMSATPLFFGGFFTKT